VTDFPASHRDLLEGQGFATLATAPTRSSRPTRARCSRRGPAAKYGQDFTQHDQPGEGRVVVTLRPVAVNAVDISG